MQPIPEAELLLAKIQQGHADHVKVEIELAATFLDLSDVEKKSLDIDAGAKSLSHARQALDIARRGLAHIASLQIRTPLEIKLNQVEAEVQKAEASQSARS